MTTEQGGTDQNLKCGDCQNFKIKEGETHYNCTDGLNSGASFGMQVRDDSRACDGFKQK